nr:protein bps1, chloroplastic [Quercus suber]
MHGDSILVQRTLELKTVPPILNKLVESLDLPKVKNSAKWKVLMRVMYGVKVETLFISSVFASAFSGSARKFFDLNVDDKYTLSRLNLHLMHGDSILVQRTLELKTVPPILNKLVESLDLPKVKNSAKWKVLMRVMYGVKVETLFICGVFASAFSGSARKFFDLNVDDKYTWAQALTGLQTSINSEIRN